MFVRRSAGMPLASGRARSSPTSTMLGESGQQGPPGEPIGAGSIVAPSVSSLGFARPSGCASDGQTPRSDRPLAATWAPVYRSGAGHPRQAATSPERDFGGPPGPGPPAYGDASVEGVYPVGNPHLWTALWTTPGTKGRDPGERCDRPLATLHRDLARTGSRRRMADLARQPVALQSRRGRAGPVGARAACSGTGSRLAIWG